jgi:hypothetical protein
MKGFNLDLQGLRRNPLLLYFREDLPARLVRESSLVVRNTVHFIQRARCFERCRSQWTANRRPTMNSVSDTKAMYWSDVYMVSYLAMQPYKRVSISH